jgi:tRNA(fMet)-specific endonuclease VapC
MIILDADTVTLFFYGNVTIEARVRDAAQEVVTTTISRIEILRGRFDAVLKASDGAELTRAQHNLSRAESNLETLRALAIDEYAAEEFDRLRANRKLRKIGRADLLIGCIALAHRATLVTRNRRHFEQVPGLAVEDWSV